MKASELRIGNYLERKTSINTWDEFKVRPIDIYRLSEVNSWLTEHRPIPLTEEWLLKFGFEKFTDCRDTLRQEFYDSFQLDIDRFTIISFSMAVGYNDIRCNYDKSYRSDENKKNYSIKHVHQLQNLYFALTNEELALPLSN